ncbi:MAG: hypothetical protein QME58_03310 [Bacteroidota bacterium]|nr:hypothetical protein [Bacteroidota bacterium]
MIKKKKYERWTKEEINLLKKHCPVNGVVYTSKLLGRSINTIRATAHIHKIRCKNPTPTWDPKNVEYLIKWYGKIDTDKIAKKIGTTKLAVQKHASRLELTRKS